MIDKVHGGIAIIINNKDGRILPSETFLSAHINFLPKPVVPLVGIPAHRILINESNKIVPTRSIIPLGLRWLSRRLGLSTIETQDRNALSRFLRKRKISAVLAEYGPTAVSVMDACKDASVPLIAHFHGFDAYTHDVISIFGKKYLKLFNQASAIIAVSEHMRKQLLSIGASEKTIFVNPCGADISSQIVAHPSSSSIRFIMVGRLVEKKAPFISLMAFSKVAQQFPDAILDIIGDGPLLNVCRQMAECLKINDQVIFHGSQPHIEVFSMLKTARCYIQHSVCAPNNDHEGTPVSILEAMGVGLPVVATRHGGISDIIENGVTGTLIDEYDVDSMADAMLVYANDSELSQQTGEMARSAVMTHWTNTISVQKLSRIIETVIRNY